MLHHDGATLLIDSGDLHDIETLPEVKRNASRWGFTLQQAAHLMVTHAHFDHASHAAALQRRGVKILTSPITAEAMAAGDDRCIGCAVNRVFELCQANILLEDGRELQVGNLRVRCLAAPGHKGGLVVFEVTLDEKRL